MAKFTIFSNTCSVDGNFSEQFAYELINYDYKIVDSKEANFIIFFTCGSTMTGIEKSMEELDELASKTSAKIILAGCATLNEKFVKHYENNPQFKIFKGYNVSNDIHKYILNSKLEFEEEMDSKTNGPSVMKVLPIERGCTNKCSFCKYNYLDSKIESTPLDDVIKYVNMKTEEGLKSLVLLGTNLADYGKDEFGKPMLHELLRKLSYNDKLEIIDVVTLTPKNMYKELENEIINNPKIKNIEMELETASNDLLKKLNRGYTREDFLYYVKKFREANKNISTVFMTGLPGETYDDLNDNINFCLKNNIFIYKIHELIDSDELPLSNNYPKMDLEERKKHTEYLTKEAILANKKIFDKYYLNTIHEGIIVDNYLDYEPSINIGAPFLCFSNSQEIKNMPEGSKVNIKIDEYKKSNFDLYPKPYVKKLKM